LLGVVDGGLWQWPHDGKFGLVAALGDDLIMYKEVKVLTVDEFYEKWYHSDDDSYLSLAHKLAAAIKRGEVE
jgi:hypothetical protein